MTAFLKLLILVLFSLVLSFVRNQEIIALLFSAVFLSFLLAGVKKGFYRLKSLFYISLALVIFNLVFLPDPDWRTRILKGVTSPLKFISLSMAVYLFTWSTSLSEIIGIFAFIPAKLRLTVTITLSLIPAILEETEQIKLVQTARGFKPNPFNPLSSIMPVIIPLLVRILNRAQHIALVLESKNYERK